MSLRSFLFTERIPQKYVRHIAFWICSFLPFFLMGIIVIYSKSIDVDAVQFIINQFYWFPNILMDMIFTYTVAYYVIPSYQKNRKVSRLISRLLLLIFITFILKAMYWYSGVHFYHNSDKFWVSTWFMITNFFNDGALMRCGLFLGCQTLKNYYLRSEEKAGILRENATAELQLLKAQVHPHFLFNTLNNIYSFSLSRSPFASSLVLKLSDTLRYMITECEAPLVPLEKELKMLNDYIGLESVRYGTRLNVEIKFEGDTDDKMIAPLLLIPLVENSFKHGTSQMLEQPWIRMIINTRENDLEFHLSNSKPEKINTQDRNNGIGLRNVQKRIQLLYPLQHEFKIENLANAFNVFIRVPLHHPKVVNNTTSNNNIQGLTLAYDNR